MNTMRVIRKLVDIPAPMTLIKTYHLLLAKSQMLICRFIVYFYTYHTYNIGKSIINYNNDKFHNIS